MKVISIDDRSVRKGTRLVVMVDDKPRIGDEVSVVNQDDVVVNVARVEGVSKNDTRVFYKAYAVALEVIA